MAVSNVIWQMATVAVNALGERINKCLEDSD